MRLSVVSITHYSLPWEKDINIKFENIVMKPKEKS